MVEDILKITLPTPFSVGDVNVYLIKGEKLTLIDAGVKTDECWEQFQMQLHELGFRVKDIDQVVLTHHHPDHVGMLDFFPTNIEIIGHPKNSPWISQDEQFFVHHEQFFQGFFNNMGIPMEFSKFLSGLRKPLKFSCHRQLSCEVIEGSKIPGLSEWQVIEVPGHASSHIALFRARDGVLICGDTLLAHISPNPLIEPPSIGELERDKPLLQYNESLKKLLKLDISLCFTGHGEEITDVSQLIPRRLLKQKERAELVLAMLKERPMTAFEVCQQLFPTVYKKELGLTMSETVGQLDFLEDLGEITIDKSNVQWLFVAK